jgi:hypothetical protein
MHSQVTLPRRRTRRGRAIGLGSRARLFRLTLFLTYFLPRLPGISHVKRRRVTRRGPHQRIHRIIERGDVGARARKS